MDTKRNAGIYWELNILTLLYYLEAYGYNWTTHLRRTDRYRIPRLMKNYRPNGKTGPWVDLIKDEMTP